MVFSSIPFLFFFLPIFLLIYYLVPFKFKNIILLIASLIFYAWGEPIYILLMIFSSIVDYINGRLLNKIKDKRKRKYILIESIIVNLLLLSFFKYSNFIIDNINCLFNLNLENLSLSLPIGISFFTFQTMSYTIDVYKNNVKAEKNFINFMTYVCMFPQLIAGPIVRYSTIGEELNKRVINKDNFINGFIRFLKGLYKKVLLANTFGFIWDSINITSSSKLVLILAIISFSLQIYFDFSGYSDMAIGLGRMLGFNYLENFNYPYMAKSITDFWRRWHISLSTFFKDYIYIPLGGNKLGTFKQIRNILIVWILTGLWHGASWNFVIWGLYFGIMLLIEKFLLNNIKDKIPNIIKHIYALLFILIGWMIFAFDNINDFNIYINSFINNNFISNDILFYIFNYALYFIIGIIFSTNYPVRMHKWFINRKYNLLYKIIFIILVILLFIISVSFLVSDTYNPFLYFRF